MSLLDSLSRMVERKPTRRDGTPGSWDVMVNGVRVGEIDADDYDEIQRVVYRDIRTWWRQLMDLAQASKKVASLVLSTVIYGVPIGGFWFLTFLAINDPAQFGSVIADLTEPELFIEAVELLVGLCLTIAVLRVIFASFPSSVESNAFEREVAQRVRRRLQVAADGDLTLFKVADFPPHEAQGVPGEDLAR